MFNHEKSFAFMFNSLKHMFFNILAIVLKQKISFNSKKHMVNLKKHVCNPTR